MRKINLYTVTAYVTTTSKKYGYTTTSEPTRLIVAKKRPQAYKKMYRAVVTEANHFGNNVDKIRLGNAFKFDYTTAVKIAKRTGAKVL